MVAGMISRSAIRQPHRPLVISPVRCRNCAVSFECSAIGRGESELQCALCPVVVLPVRAIGLPFSVRQRAAEIQRSGFRRTAKNEFPVRYHGIMDTRRWGPGERIVFEPYTAEAFAQSRDWIAEREIFEGGKSSMGTDTYTDAVVRLT
jgi:hypothetical protein